MSKVLIINGSPRLNGNTAIAVREMEKVFHENDVEVTTVQIGNKVDLCQYFGHKKLNFSPSITYAERIIS